MCEAFVLLLMF